MAIEASVTQKRAGVMNTASDGGNALQPLRICDVARTLLIVDPISNESSMNFKTKETAMTEYKSDLLFGALTGNGRVLVVDDEPAVRTIVRMILEKAGYEVLEAENGEAAITALNTGENRLVLDVVICDIRMPKINGVQAIEYFQREYPHVPVIVLTAYPETKMAVSFMRSGVADYLIKPVDARKLKDAVDKAMERRHVAWA